MSSFTKEELIAEINYNLEHCYCSEKTKRLMEIALASLEAEPVGYFGRFEADDEELIDQCSPSINGAFPLYAAPPAPVSVPDAIHSQGEKSASDDYYALGWNACRAAMLQEAK